MPRLVQIHAQVAARWIWPENIFAAARFDSDTARRVLPDSIKHPVHFIAHGPSDASRNEQIECLSRDDSGI
jgi:hypothetical protein